MQGNFQYHLSLPDDFTASSLLPIKKAPISKGWRG